MTYLSKHFTTSEFACKCGECGYSKGYLQVHHIDMALVVLLEDLRRHFGKPVRITSGRRCLEHNRDVGGAPTSQHTLGRAADVQIDGITPNAIYNFINDGPMTDRIGLSEYSTFVHIDVRGNRARW